MAQREYVGAVSFVPDLPSDVENTYYVILDRGTSINDVPRFLAIFDLPNYLVLL